MPSMKKCKCTPVLLEPSFALVHDTVLTISAIQTFQKKKGKQTVIKEGRYNF